MKGTTDLIPLKVSLVPVLKKIQAGKAEICLWKITEQIADFSVSTDDLESDHTTRNKQWMASRAALEALDVDVSKLQKDDFGKPYLRGKGKHLSLSHCSKYAAGITGSLPVGIDIEEITPRIERIAKRFVHDKEWEFIKKSKRIETLYILWSAKEALYKLYGKKAVDFKNHMIARPFKTTKSGWFEMEFLKDTKAVFTIQYEIYDNHSLVWVEGEV